jgi:signal transduction histidine kinase
MTGGEQILFEKIIYAAYFFPLALSGMLIWFLVFYIGRKHRNEIERKNLLLKQQSLIIEKQRAVEHERNRIAAEMHDDLGSGLTKIKYLSERAVRKAENTTEAEQIQRIAEQSNQLVTNMSEIIWAMNSRFDTAENLTGYIRRYASEYLEDYNIALRFKGGETMSEIRVTAEKRRNIFLVVKEILHNAVKYSGSPGIRIEMATDESVLTVRIHEEAGKGFDPDQASSY